MKSLGVMTVTVAGAVLLSLAACHSSAVSNDDAVSSSNESPAASMTAEEAATLMGSMAAPAPDASLGMAGHWQGPEGTSMLIAPASNGYDVTITNLDGPRTFHGDVASEGITIHRDGKALTIRHGDGTATGMKWLADKKDCLVVDANEGYCRN